MFFMFLFFPIQLLSYERYVVVTGGNTGGFMIKYNETSRGAVMEGKKEGERRGNGDRRKKEGGRKGRVTTRTNHD